MIFKKFKFISLSILLGSLASFAFPPYNYTFLLYISYFGLFYILFKSKTLKHSLINSFLFGFFHYIVGLYWLFSIIKDYDKTYWFFIAVILFGIIITLSLLFGLLGLGSFLIKKVFCKVGCFDYLIILSIFATLLEWIRGFIFTGFPWFRVSHSLCNIEFFTYYLPIVGELGVAYIFFMQILLTIYFVFFKRRILLFLVISISFFILTNTFIKNIEYSLKLDKALYIQIIKTNFSKEDKGSINQVYYNVKNFLYRSLQEPLPDISIWSESSIPIGYDSIINSLRTKFDKVSQNNTIILFGTYVTENKQHFDVIKSSKDFQTVYTKMHLIPFGEYMPNWFKPFKNLIPKVYMSDLSIKRNIPFYTIKDINISCSICYELLFEDELLYSIKVSNLLINISDLGWFDNKIAKDYLLAIAKIRAIESQKPMIYVANSGNSAFISYKGDIDKNSDYKHIVPRKGVTIFIKYGNNTIFFIFIIILLLILIKKLLKYLAGERYG